MSSSTKSGLTRRGLLGGLGAGAGVVSLAALTPVQAALLPEPETSETYDVVVIGSGLAGCAAALEAAESGARVIVLEKAPQSRMGGNSFLAGGYFALPDNGSAAARTGFVEDFDAFCLGRGNVEIFRLMAANALDDVEWLRGHGVDILPPTASPTTRVSTAIAGPAPFAGMPGLFRVMRDRIPAFGGRLAFNTKARQLILDKSGAVAGVRAIGPDGVVDYRASGGVVIAAGGYAGNTAMLEAYADPNAGAMMVRGITHATGDGLLMAQAAGAGLRGMGGLMSLHIAAVDALETAAGQPAFAVPYAISINNEGNRFIDESLGYVAHGKAVLDQPGQTTNLILDQALREVPAVEGVFGTFARLGIAVHQADTIEELAAIIGVPAAQMAGSVAAFNAAIVNDQALGAHPPKKALAKPIETPPFYAFSPLAPGITLTFGGVIIDTEARVLEADGRMIPGLFAAGEGAGGVFFHDYIGGGSMTNCLVMGRIAGRQASLAAED
jgi:flavocytochrome c